MNVWIRGGGAALELHSCYQAELFSCNWKWETYELFQSRTIYVGKGMSREHAVFRVVHVTVVTVVGLLLREDGSRWSREAASGVSMEERTRRRSSSSSLYDTSLDSRLWPESLEVS